MQKFNALIEHLPDVPRNKINFMYLQLQNATGVVDVILAREVLITYLNALRDVEVISPELFDEILKHFRFNLFEKLNKAN